MTGIFSSNDLTLLAAVLTHLRKLYPNKLVDVTPKLNISGEMTIQVHGSIDADEAKRLARTFAWSWKEGQA